MLGGCRSAFFLCNLLIEQCYEPASRFQGHAVEPSSGLSRSQIFHRGAPYSFESFESNLLARPKSADVHSVLR